ncbi:ABC transporter substrate-binding protein [Bradyrhizobium sp. dw_78]|uniref:ABC transporter substrate-binding protein n=1 Tax=Bradyrhizobium sp. dw_78 TaxID=2719793 RepID=UPI001BD46347|nr:ABC transporter substrate-binding protein [Bradyrhizobium sp. dw_78]
MRPSRRNALKIATGALVASGMPFASVVRAKEGGPPIRIGYWATGVQLALIELLKRQKIFEKYGLNYELVSFADVNGNTVALATDRIDVAFSVAGPGALDLAARQRPIKIILATQAADGRLVTKRAEIKEIADLRGKTVGTAPVGSAGYAYTTAFLSRSYGLETNSYKVAGGGEARLIQLLVQGDIDAALLREVSFVQYGERLGLRSLADQRVEWAKIAGPHAIPPLGVGVAQDRMIKERRDDVVAFVASIVDGIRTGASDPALVSSLMAQLLKLSDEEAAAYAKTWPISFHGEFEDADVASLDFAQQLFVAQGSLAKAADKSSFDQSLYQDAVKRLK